MNKKCTWCWVAYAIPGLLLLGWYAAGHEPGTKLSLLAWLYGFPSTALGLPIVGLFWNLDSKTEFVVTTLLAMIVNGATWSLILRLLREAAQPETPVHASDSATKPPPSI